MGAAGSGFLSRQSRAKAARVYSEEGLRVMAPLAGHEILVRPGGEDVVCARLLGLRAANAWLDVLRVRPWLAHGAHAGLICAGVLSCLSVFSVPLFRGWATACLVTLLAAPAWMMGVSLICVPVLKRMLSMFEPYFLLFTVTGGLTALAYALDNQFDERALILLGGWLPCLLLAIFGDAGRPSQRKVGVSLCACGSGGLVVFMARLCTLPSSRLDAAIAIWTLEYAVSNIAFSYLLTAALFLLRATLLMLLRPGCRFIVSAPMRMMPIDMTTPDTGEPLFQGLKGGLWSPGALVLAPAPHAAITFSTKRTLAALLLGSRRADALWRVARSASVAVTASVVAGTALGIAMMFGTAVTWPGGIVSFALLLPGGLFLFAFANADLLVLLLARFEVCYLVVETLTITFGIAATFTWNDPRSIMFAGLGLWGALACCFVDSWHTAVRRSGGPYLVLIGLVGVVIMVITIAANHDLAQAAPNVTLGTLQWQVSKMAFDAGKILAFFYAKHLLMALQHPLRYGQLRTPLVEQRVPNVEAPAAPDPPLSVPLNGESE
jgi:hypothetical protein